MRDDLQINFLEQFDYTNVVQICRGKKVYLYGAGMVASYYKAILEQYHIPISAYIVSALQTTGQVKEGIPVIAAEDFCGEGIVFFAITYKEVKEVCSVVKKSVNEIYVVSIDAFENTLTDYFVEEFHRVVNDKKFVLERNERIERFHLLCKYVDQEEIKFRLPLFYLLNHNMEQLRDLLSEKNPIELFREQYGKFIYLPECRLDSMREKMTYHIYMARCHVDKSAEQPRMFDWLIPIQTGTALTDMDICKVKDNQGENISERNRDYSECTALYWMGKNAKKADYIGLCHYRRHFVFPQNDINVIGDNDVDIVVVIPTIVDHNYDYFRQFVTEEDIMCLREAVEQLYPDYVQTVERYYQGSFCPPCNMSVMRYDIFQDYVKFAFDITFYIEEHYKKRGIVRNDRYLGYLMENLTDIFVMKHVGKYKIAYTDMLFYS